MDDNAVLTIQIDRKWSAADFANEMGALHYVHAAELVLHIASQPLGIPPTRRRDFRSSAYQFLAQDKWSGAMDAYIEMVVRSPMLQVLRLQYSSLGFQDFFGLAKALEVIVKFVQDLIELKHKREDHALQVRRQEEELTALGLQNMERRIALLKSLGYSERRIRTIMTNWKSHENRLAALVSERKIKAITLKH